MEQTVEKNGNVNSAETWNYTQQRDELYTWLMYFKGNAQVQLIKAARLTQRSEKKQES